MGYYKFYVEKHGSVLARTQVLSAARRQAMLMSYDGVVDVRNEFDELIDRYKNSVSLAPPKVVEVPVKLAKKKIHRVSKEELIEAKPVEIVPDIKKNIVIRRKADIPVI